jgi:AcrR family transcriptional regulator
MARPRNAHSHETRLRLLGVARDLFATQGLDGVSIREIAAAGNVTGATVMHYFGNKDGLYAACIDTLDGGLEGMREEVMTAIAGAPDMDQAIDAGMRAVFQLARRNQTAIKLLLRHVADTGEIGLSRRENRLLPFLEMGAALFAERTGQSPAELRLTLQSLVFLVGRWAVASAREASAVSGVRGASAAFQVIEDHLVAVARRQLAPVTSPRPA